MGTGYNILHCPEVDGQMSIAEKCYISKSTIQNCCQVEKQPEKKAPVLEGAEYLC